MMLIPPVEWRPRYAPSANSAAVAATYPMVRANSVRLQSAVASPAGW